MYLAIVHWAYPVSSPRLSTQSMRSEKTQYVHLKSLCDRLSELERNLETYSSAFSSGVDGETKLQKVNRIWSGLTRDQTQSQARSSFTSWNKIKILKSQWATKYHLFIWSLKELLWVESQFTIFYQMVKQQN